MNDERRMLFTAVIDDICGSYTKRKVKRQQALVELIPAIVSNSIETREQNRLQSRGLNVFRFFKPGETTHSRLLAFFLDPNESHGQGDLFLVKFLKLLGIDQPESVPTHPWIVTAELGRVDVLIKRKHPHAVVVIENKSNFASDQPNQLYRYWYQEIYSKQKERKAVEEEILNPSTSCYRVIYLSPASWKQAEDQSVLRPEKGYEGYPEAVPKGIIQHSLFSDLVVKWLTESLSTESLSCIPRENYRLREFTEQYIQFWKSN